MHQNQIAKKHPRDEENVGPLDIAEKGSKIGSDWFDDLVKKDFPSSKEENENKNVRKK